MSKKWHLEFFKTLTRPAQNPTITVIMIRRIKIGIFFVTALSLFASPIAASVCLANCPTIIKKMDCCPQANREAAFSEASACPCSIGASESKTGVLFAPRQESVQSFSGVSLVTLQLRGELNSLDSRGIRPSDDARHLFTPLYVAYSTLRI